jgi:phosphoglucomutase
VAASSVLALNGIKVYYFDEPVPTPVMAYIVNNMMVDEKKVKLAGSINFTASHNPPKYSGLKFSPSHGGAATSDITGWIEKRANEYIGKERIAAVEKEIGAAFIPVTLKRDEIAKQYIEYLKNSLILRLLKKAGSP